YVVVTSFDGIRNEALGPTLVGGVLSATVSARVQGRAVLLKSSPQYDLCPFDAWTARGRVSLGVVSCWGPNDVAVSDDGAYVAFVQPTDSPYASSEIRIASMAANGIPIDVATGLPRGNVQLAIAGAYLVASWETMPGSVQIASFALSSGTRTDVATTD